MAETADIANNIVKGECGQLAKALFRPGDHVPDARPVSNCRLQQPLHTEQAAAAYSHRLGMGQRCILAGQSQHKT